MTMLILTAAVAFLVWLAVYLKRGSMLLGLTSLLVVGSCFGHPFLNYSLGPLPITLDRVLWGGLLVQYGIWRFCGRTDPKPICASEKMLCGFAVILVLSTFLHDWTIDQKTPLALLLFFYVIPLGVYWMSRHIQVSRHDLMYLYGGLIALGVYLALTAIAETRGLWTVVFPKYIASEEYIEFFGRGRGPFLNPVACGIFQIVGLAAGLMGWPRVGPWGKGMILAFGLLMMAGIYCTLTRSVWMAAAVGCGLILWLAADRAKRGLLLAGGAVFVSLAAAFFLDDVVAFKRDKYVTTAQMSQSASLRPLLAEVAFKMFQDRPWLGCGLGQYQQVSAPYHFDNANGPPLRKVMPYVQHNLFLALLTELGLIGCGLFTGLLLVWSWNAWRLWQNTQLDLLERQTGLLMLVLVVAFVINGLFHDVSIMPMTGTLLMMMAGLTSGLAYRSTNPTAARDECSHQPADEQGRFADHLPAAGQAAC